MIGASSDIRDWGGELMKNNFNFEGFQQRCERWGGIARRGEVLKWCMAMRLLRALYCSVTMRLSYVGQINICYVR
jgi:hypothetical protein